MTLSGLDFKSGRSPQLGLIGTGFVAKLRAEALVADGRARVTAVASHQPDKARAFAETHNIAQPCANWATLLARPELDGVIICNINSDHGPVVRAALEAGKFVIVEYPLALSAPEAAELLALAQQRHLLLHVEHIELLGGAPSGDAGAPAPSRHAPVFALLHRRAPKTSPAKMDVSLRVIWVSAHGSVVAGASVD